ncbi:MAG: hypothetical protein AB1505_23155 [Candidatus Latescibacterota bacterium]
MDRADTDPIGLSPYKPGSIERGGFSLRGTRSPLVPAPPRAVPRGERQLLMSHQIVEDWYDCRRTVHAVEKDPANPLLAAREPWEEPGPTGNGSVLFDEGLGRFRLWTQIWPETVPGKERIFRGVYYESADGLHWERPALRQMEYGGSRDNNLLDLGPFLPATLNVFRLPPAHRHLGRFGMVMAGQRLQPLSADDHRMEQFLCFSEDGYTWRPPEDNFFRGRCDCSQSIVWNPERQVFMYYRRATVNACEVRRIAYTESPDLRTWTQPRVVIGPDELDTIYLYGMPVSRYQSMYLGLLQNLYAHADHDHVKPAKSHEVEVQLAWSVDGIAWERHPERPVFIPTGPLRAGVPDWGMVFALNEIVDVGDRAWVYYSGCEGLHTSVVPGRRRNLCLGAVRRDGFVSLDAPREGWVLTAPLRCPGGRLHINACTQAGGAVQVAVREAEGVRDGEWPPEWSLDRAVPFTGDAVDHPVAWQGQQDLSAWAGRSMRLEFRLLRASLYSFWFE